MDRVFVVGESLCIFKYMGANITLKVNHTNIHLYTHILSKHLYLHIKLDFFSPSNRCLNFIFMIIHHISEFPCSESCIYRTIVCNAEHAHIRIPKRFGKSKL